MRDIKFRAWQDNKMLTQPMSGNYAAARFFGFLYEDASAMQYTGLKDKNGKEIYEGDIVKNGLSGTWIVQPLERGSMSLLGICRQYKDKEFDISALNSHVEVIGNIHENSDLLTPLK